MFEILCVFTPQGKTFTFRDVDIITNNETFLQFSYKAMSDGKIKIGNFPKDKVVGWSTTRKEADN